MKGFVTLPLMREADHVMKSFRPSRVRNMLTLSNGGCDSSVGIATLYGLDESRWGRDFPHPSRPALGPHPASCAMGTGSFPGVKRPRRGVDPPPHLQCRG